MLSQEEIFSLVRRAQNGEEDAKTILVEENTPLIKSVIRRYLGKGLEYDDLYQLGCLGFVKAIRNFKEDFNVKFSTYVVPMVMGEIKRFMRDDGAIKVSRAIKTLNIKINRFIDAFYEEHKEKPTISEIAKEFKVEEEDIVLAMDSAKMPISLYAPLEGEDGSLLVIDRVENENFDNSFMDNMALKEIINSLPERERKIIYLRYFLDKTQSEVAEKFKISQVQVSRIENKVLGDLKKKLS